MIIPMEKKHTAEVGTLHHKYIKSILRDLGEQTCIAFYETVLESKNNFGFVYVENSRVLGFVFGTEENAQLFKHPRIRYKIAISLLRRPWVIKKIIARQFKKLPSGPEGSFIAVEREFRRKGVANQLMISIFEEFKRRNYTRIMGWVDEGNEPMLALFVHEDSEIVGEFREDGKRRFIIDYPVEDVIKAFRSANRVF